MSDFFRAFAQLTGLIALSTLFALVIFGCYLVLSVFLLGPMRVLRGGVGRGAEGAGRAGETVGARLERFAEAVGDWRIRTTSLAAYDDSPEAGHPDDERTSLLHVLVDTLVFSVTMVATLLLLIISANLLGLERWTGADTALPWLIGIAVVLVSAYAWSRLWHRRRWSMDRWAALVVFGLTVVAFLVLAVLRGIDVWIQQINEDNTVRAVAAGTPITPPPAFLSDLRAGLPAATYFFAELAIIGGGALAHRGLLGLLGIALTIGALAFEGIVLIAYLLVRLVGVLVQIALRLVGLLLEVLMYVPATLYRWLMRYDRVRGRLRLQPLLDEREPSPDIEAQSEPAAPAEPLPASDDGYEPVPLSPPAAEAPTAFRDEPAPSELRPREEPVPTLAELEADGLPEQESAVRTIGELRGRRPE